MSICGKFARVAPGSTTLSADAQAILESMGDAFYALDGDWRFVYANQRALAFWNTTADTVIGQVIWQRFPDMVGTLNQEVLHRVREEQRAITFEAPSPTTGVWVSVNVGPSGDGVTVYWRDISQRIEAENALRTFAEKLEREVAERTRVLNDVVDELRRVARPLQRDLRAFAGRSGVHGHPAGRPDRLRGCQSRLGASFGLSKGLRGRQVAGGGPAARAGGIRHHAVPPRDRNQGAGRIRVQRAVPDRRGVAPLVPGAPAGRQRAHRARAADRRRSDRDAPGRGAIAPGAEDGGDRPAHRRHRPRLQQSAHRGDRQSRAAATPADRRALAVAGRCGHALRVARRTAHPATAGLCAPSEPVAAAGRRECRDRRHGRSAATQSRRPRAGGDRSRARSLAGDERSDAARTRRAQPRHQLPGRDAQWRATAHRDRQRERRRDRRVGCSSNLATMCGSR